MTEEYLAESDAYLRMIGPGRMFSDGVVTLLVFVLVATTSGLRAVVFSIWALCTMMMLLSYQYELSKTMHEQLSWDELDCVGCSWDVSGMMIDYIRGNTVILFGSIAIATLCEMVLRRVWLAFGAAGYYQDRYHLGAQLQILNAFHNFEAHLNYHVDCYFLI